MASGGPMAAVRRAWRRFMRRPTSVKVGALVGAIIVIGGAAAGIALASSGASSSNSSSTTGQSATTTVSSSAIDTASTSTRGVSATTINVVFPVSNLTSLASNFGFAGDVEFGQQDNAIHTFVNAINDSGGINGRKINAIIVPFDPTDETSMRALCEQWTKGSPPVFAVLDGLGSFTGDNELCITQEGHTPFIGQWTTVTNYTDEGAPYLWWTGPDQAVILRTLVSWAKSSGRLGSGDKLGVVEGDRASDQQAYSEYLAPALRQAGITNYVVESLPAQLSEGPATTADAPLVVQRLKAAGVNTVIPLIPFNAFFPYLQAESTQDYAPKLLLSDYEGSIESALGLIPVPYEKQLDNQEGVTVETLGGTDAPIPESEGGYDPGVRACYATWHAAHPKPLPGQTLIHGEKATPYIEEQGPIAGWCGVIKLFAAAAKKAGPDLNRRTFVQAMASIKDFPGTYTPLLTFGPQKFAGPVEYRVVEVHNNVPASSACVLTSQHITQGTCWHIVQNWRPLADG